MMRLREKKLRSKSAVDGSKTIRGRESGLVLRMLYLAYSASFGSKSDTEYLVL